MAWSCPRRRPEVVRHASPAFVAARARRCPGAQRLENKQQAFDEAHKNDPSPQRIANCQTARNNVNVLDEQRPVYSYDDKGNHKYVEDKDRAAALATAQRQVSDNCR